MKDCQGIELKIGDKVVCIAGKNSLAELAVGNVTKVYDGYHYGEEECSVYIPTLKKTQAHIMSARVMKL